MMAALAVTAMTLGELLGPSSAGDHAAARVQDLVLSSADVRPGAAFVALAGTRAHGMHYAANALARGAACVLFDADDEMAAAVAAGNADLASRALGLPGLSGRLGELAQTFYARGIQAGDLAGVTGTNGKTTVAYLVAQAASRLDGACGYIGTLGYGVPPALTPHALTTPDTFTLHRELVAIEARRVAIEVSSHALAQNRVAGLSLRTAAFTNLTQDHLDAHGTLEAYGDEKARLFSRAELRRAVINVGDPFGARLAARLPASVDPIRVRAFSATDARADAANDGAQRVDVIARATLRGLDGLTLDVSGRFGRAAFDAPLIGAFNAENLVVALGTLLAWDVPLAPACAALAECSAPPGRLEVIGDPLAAQPRVVVDYAHTPDALSRTLDALRDLAVGDVWCVFGCGGERDRTKRAPMGRTAAAKATHLVVTDDNPRNEDPQAIVRDVLAGVGAHPSVVVEHDRGAAIAYAVRAARPGDAVLIAGKGHETTQRAGRVTRPFSDRAAARTALRERA